MRRLSIPSVYALVFAPVFLASATGATGQQDLRLFEPVETAETAQPRPERATREDRNRAAAPEFVLVGTSRFGDDYRATLRDRNGRLITVQGGQNQSIQIPGHNNFRVADIRSRYVAVQHPANNPCVEFTEHGVSCAEGSNIARLQLATAEAIEPPQPRASRRGDNGEELAPGEQTGQQGEGEDADERPNNPFSAALRRAAEQSPEDQAAIRAQQQRFQQRRIDPADVPPGRRVVRTPFGDRIIDE